MEAHKLPPSPLQKNKYTKSSLVDMPKYTKYTKSLIQYFCL